MRDGVRPAYGLERVTRHPFFTGLVLVMGAHAVLAEDAIRSLADSGYGELSPAWEHEIDRRLLSLLSVDGRRSYADLAHEVGLSAPSVYARVKKLEDRGVIKQFTITTSPEQLGYGLAAVTKPA